MYADAESNKTVKDRRNRGPGNFPSRRRQVTGKRQRQADKWEHDLFEDELLRLPKRRVDPRDLRLKLQKKRSSQNGQESGSDVRDLRETLSGTICTQPRNINPPKSNAVATRPLMNSTIIETETRRTSNQSTRKKLQQTAEASSVDSFLESLGLEKYKLIFQAEEVDMATLLHITDDDLKSMSIPLGPRKKILFALASKH